MPGRLHTNMVTKGAQVLLPLYPALAIGVGLLFLFQQPSRTSGAAFVTAKELMTIPQWGIIFLALAAWMAVSFIAHNSTWLRFAIIASAGLCGFWAILLLISAARDNHASYTSCLWVGFVAGAHIASARGLSRDGVFRASP